MRLAKWRRAQAGFPSECHRALSGNMGLDKCGATDRWQFRRSGAHRKWQWRQNACGIISRGAVRLALWHNQTNNRLAMKLATLNPAC
jgi:hypothetical protein